jgi:hypothetical protein
MNIREKLEADFPPNYLVIAVEPETAAYLATADGMVTVTMLHSVFYEDKPTDKDLKALYEELQTDEEFKITIPFELLIAPSSFRDSFLKTLEKEEYHD